MYIKCTKCEIFTSLRFRAQLKHRRAVIGISKKSSFDKSTELKSLEANEKFTLSKNVVASALIFFFFHNTSLAAVQSLRQFRSLFD